MEFRRIQFIPMSIQRALENSALMDEYLARPDYQQHDYLDWIANSADGYEYAERLNRMLDELAEGVAYMTAPYSAKV